MNGRVHIRALIGAGMEIGPGLACRASPLCGFIVTGFYDGATEGFARAKSAETLIFFQKTWWDHRQDIRVFECTAVPFAELKMQEPDLSAFYERRAKVADWSAPFSDADGKLAEELKRFIVQSPHGVRFVVFCKNMTEEIFLLPVTDDSEATTLG